MIGQLGIGTDGHIAGILPGSAAAHETSALVAAYDAAPFKRLTVTFQVLRQIDAAFVFAFGKPKRKTLEILKAGSMGTIDQPAGILHELQEAYVYNDQVGEDD